MCVLIPAKLNIAYALDDIEIPTLNMKCDFHNNCLC